MKAVTKLIAGLTMLVSAGTAVADELVVYSSRIEALIKPIFDVYTKETGTQVKFLTGSEGALLEKLKAEGPATPADVLITVDAGNLWLATHEGVLASVDSKVLEANIPAHLRDPEGHWFGLSVRARTIAYNTSKVKPSELSTYEDLASPKWKGRLCLRTSKKVYNQSLVAMMIARLGEKKTEEIVKGWVANLATDPISDDTKVLEAIAAGQCDAGIVNTYYYGRLMKKSPDLPLALFWPNQKTSGVHVNISGAGVIKHSKNKAAAVKLLEWLSSPEAQNLFADQNMEYPANPKVEPHEFVASWGRFKHDSFNLAQAGKLQADAVKLMDRAGYK